MPTKIKFIFLTYTALALTSCNNEEKSSPSVPMSRESLHEQMRNRISKQEAEMHKSTELNNSTANITVKAYWDFAQMFPDDTLCADYLFKAGEISTATKQYSQALMYYKKITDSYPKYKMLAESYYLQGVLLDNYLNDETEAKNIYEKVIKDYSNTPYANDARSAINNLGKSDEELIKEFERKNKGK